MKRKVSCLKLRPCTPAYPAFLCKLGPSEISHDGPGVEKQEPVSPPMTRTLALVLVPNTPRSMMRKDTFHPSLFTLLHGIIQEEVDQDGIHFSLWVVPRDLPPYEFYTPDATTCSALALMPRPGTQ